MDTRFERMNAALAALEGRTAREVSQACSGFVSERTVLYLRSDERREKMKRPPNKATVAALETAARVLGKDRAA